MQHAAAPSMQTRPDGIELFMLSAGSSSWNSSLAGVGGALNGTTCSSTFDAARAFSRSYGAAHGYVSIVVCFAGLAANAFSSAVLTRRRLWSPTNAILVSISAADLATIGVFIPYIAIYYAGACREPGSARAHAEYELVFAHVGLVAHTASVWLTVALGIFRCLAVRAKLGERHCTFRRVGAALACIAAASVLVAAPQYATLHVHQNRHGKWIVMNERLSGGSGGGGVDEATVRRRDRFLYELQTWLVIVCVKFGPCLLLAVLSGYLIHTMVSSGRSIRGGGGAGGALLSPPAVEMKRRGGGSARAARRTTLMLASVVVMFAAVGSPQALLLLLSVAFGDEFFLCAYLQLAEFFDLLTIINSSTNFAIYCSTSKQFRDEFRGLLHTARQSVLDWGSGSSGGGGGSSRVGSASDTSNSTASAAQPHSPLVPPPPI